MREHFLMVYFLKRMVENGFSLKFIINNLIIIMLVCYFGLTKLLKSRVISKNLKSQIYQTLIKPVVTYGSETWIMRKKDENALLVFERKVLRKIGKSIDHV